MLEALAPLAGLAPGVEAAAQLLLVDLNAHRADHAFRDPAAPMSDIREGNALLAYVYPSAAQGPKSGLREVHIFHRCGAAAALHRLFTGTCQAECSLLLADCMPCMSVPWMESAARLPLYIPSVVHDAHHTYMHANTP